MIVLYIERALGGMRWIWLMEEGENDQYGSACSSEESFLKMQVFMKDMQASLLSTRLKRDHAQMS